jgi:predicted ATPase
MRLNQSPKNRISKAGIGMAKSIKISNFRCFKDTELTDCRRINLVVGENGSGKTALLESILLSAGAGADLALRMRQWRGFENVQGLGTVQDFDESLWGDLFYNFRFNAKIGIRLGGNEDHKRSLKISFIPAKQTVTRVAREREVELADFLPATSGIEFDWIGPRGSHDNSRAEIVAGRLQIKGSTLSPIQTAFFASNHTYSAIETANRFSLLSRMGNELAIVEAFRQHFKNAEDLTLEIAGGVPMVFVALKNQRRKVPINLVSAGMNRLVSMLVAIPTLKNGIMIIDEVENGFYYQRFPLLWTMLNEFSKEYAVQIFASTHSLECLTAAAAEAKNSEEDFCLIRAVHGSDGCGLREYSGAQFAGSMDANFEIR